MHFFFNFEKKSMKKRKNNEEKLITPNHINKQSESMSDENPCFAYAKFLFFNSATRVTAPPTCGRVTVVGLHSWIF
jgi:hypothetical protein